jgi:hypothetical protein
MKRVGSTMMVPHVLVTDPNPLIWEVEAAV